MGNSVLKIQTRQSFFALNIRAAQPQPAAERIFPVIHALDPVHPDQGKQFINPGGDLRSIAADAGALPGRRVRSRAVF